MRYSLMLQLVAGMTLLLVGSAALFASVQSRPGPTNSGSPLSNS